MTKNTHVDDFLNIVIERVAQGALPKIPPGKQCVICSISGRVIFPNNYKSIPSEDAHNEVVSGSMSEEDFYRKVAVKYANKYPDATWHLMQVRYSYSYDFGASFEIGKEIVFSFCSVYD